MTDAGTLALGHFGKYIVAGFTVLEFFGSSCIMLVVIWKEFIALLPQHGRPYLFLTYWALTQLGLMDVKVNNQYSFSPNHFNQSSFSPNHFSIQSCSQFVNRTSNYWAFTYVRVKTVLKVYSTSKFEANYFFMRFLSQWREVKNAWWPVLASLANKSSSFLHILAFTSTQHAWTPCFKYSSHIVCMSKGLLTIYGQQLNTVWKVWIEKYSTSCFL